VDENAIAQQFKKLEERVERLVRTCRDLKEAKTKSEAKVKHLQEALKTRDAAAQRNLEKKAIVRSRIDDMLSKLDEALGSR
jgi:hypothetical protein